MLLIAICVVDGSNDFSAILSARWPRQSGPTAAGNGHARTTHFALVTASGFAAAFCCGGAARFAFYSLAAFDHATPM